MWEIQPIHLPSGRLAMVFAREVEFLGEVAGSKMAVIELAQFRLLLLAAILREGAARVELAARRRIGRRRDLAF